ncbi:hypothetical protein [Variovorax ginsengisoli]|uniref:Transcriptional regulator n=1 Tax=Variovorax ginsengisoli TaxID=363844 RepID=A0ABT8SHQ9_9BURK|nr:hypothetical protein [Variovorax ginsengisoli]MDN8618749.1 hypothetical protein [Variovorax ginsengisoli]MDO1537919.1 hypothetical protein [Variovorax ginsengisoli]
MKLVEEAMPRHAAAKLHLVRMLDEDQRARLAELLNLTVGNAPGTEAALD